MPHLHIRLFLNPEENNRIRGKISILLFLEENVSEPSIYIL